MFIALQATAQLTAQLGCISLACGKCYPLMSCSGLFMAFVCRVTSGVQAFSMLIFILLCSNSLEGCGLYSSQSAVACSLCAIR